MKKILILISVFFVIVSCSKTNKNSLIVGVIGENYTRLPIDLAIANFTSTTKMKYVETYDSYNKIAKDVSKGYIDLAIIPYPEILRLENTKKPKIKFLSPISRNSIKLIYYNDMNENQVINSGKLGILKNTSLSFLLSNKSHKNIVEYKNTLKLIADFHHHKLDGIFLFPDKIFKLYGPYKISNFAEKDFPYFPNSGIVVNRKRYSEKKAEVDSLIFQTRNMIDYIQNNPISSYKISQELYHYNMKITKNSLYTVSFSQRFSQRDFNYFQKILFEMKKKGIIKQDFQLPFHLK